MRPLRYKLVITRNKMENNISFDLKIWRQAGPKEKGHFEKYHMDDIPTDTSFLEMLDILNEQLVEKGEEPVMFDHDCRADDFEAEDDCFTIYTDPDDFNAVADALTAKGYSFVSAQIEMVPQNYQKLESEEQISLMEKLLDIMEEDDDVQNVWHNWEWLPRLTDSRSA